MSPAYNRIQRFKLHCSNKTVKKTNHTFDEFSSLVILRLVCHQKKKNMESPTPHVKKF